MRQALVLDAVIAATAALFTPMGAAASQELAQKNNCLACHAVGHAVIGPAYEEVAARYRGQAGAVATLAANIRRGGTGRWGRC